MDDILFGSLVQKELPGLKTIAIIENNIMATHTIRYKLTRVLMEKGYRVIILTTGSEDALEKARSKGFDVVDVKASNQHPLHILQYVRNLHRQLKKIKPDIVLTFTIRPAIWGNFVTRWLNIPTITNITGIGPLFEKNNIAYSGARTLYRFALKKTAFVFFQNTDDRKLFTDRGFVNPKQHGLIPGSGVDLEHYRPLNPLPAEFSFLLISRLVKDKGILEYAAACAGIKQKYPAVACKLLGPLWEQNLKANIISAEMVRGWEEKGFIEYLGEASDVRPYIDAATCVVMPSYREGTSNVLLEAAAMERPAIATDVPGCREIIEHQKTGLLCAAKSAEDLQNKMEEMIKLDHATRVEMGKQARQKVQREFNKHDVINAYLEKITNILNRRKTGASSA